MKIGNRSTRTEKMMPATKTIEADAIDFTQGAQPAGMPDARPEPQLPAVQPEQQETTILSIIERAARDPSVDIEKMDRLLAMQERVQTRQAEIEFNNAMADAQGDMQPVRADAKNPQTRSKYASYGALDDALRPIYSAHGFALIYGTGEGAPPDCLRVTCTLAHRAGHSKLYHIDMPADGKGAKGGDVMTRTHATGAAATYGRRYLLNMIFNVAITFEDDDGNGASARKPDAREPGFGLGAGGRAGAINDAQADGLMGDDTRSAYQLDRLKKARASGWVVANKAPKGRLNQIYDYLDMAENADDVAAILNHNEAAIRETGEQTRIQAAADRILQWFANDGAQP